jgi:hypothetical protein
VSLQIVRFTTRPEQAAEVERGVAHLFDGVANPLPAIPRAAAFRQQLQGWAAPGPQPVNVLGDYRMTG